MIRQPTNQERLAANQHAHEMAPAPPHVSIGEWNFGGFRAPRFMNYGGLAPGHLGRLLINWDVVRQSEAPFRIVDGNRLPTCRFSDVHCHMNNYTGDGHYIAEVCRAAERLGIKHWTMIPIPTTLVSTRNDQQRYQLYGSGSHCGEVYYVPAHMAHMTGLSAKKLQKIQKSVELRVDSSVDDNLVTEVSKAVCNGQIRPEHLSSMDLALTGIHLGSGRVKKDILKTLSRVKHLDRLTHAEMLRQGVNIHPHRLRFSQIGEVTLRKELVETLFAGKTQADLKKNIEPCREAMRLAGVIGMPWVLHCDIDKPESLKGRFDKNKRPAYLDDIKELMRSCPNTEIIWAHAGGLGRFVKAGGHHLEELTALMNDQTLNHVKLDISWSVVADQLTDPAAVNQWAQFLVNNSHRILFGSDTLTPQTEAKWMETYTKYNPALLQAMLALPNGRQAWENIMVHNYENTIVAARERVDAFVDHVLDDVVQGPQHFGGPEDVDVKAIHAYRDEVYERLGRDRPDIQRVGNYFRNRDVVLPDVVGKAREHQEIKSAANKFLQNTRFKNYAPGASGDPQTNKQLQRTALQLSDHLNRLFTIVGAFPGGARPERNAELNKLQNDMVTITNKLGTSTPPDGDIERLRNEIIHFRRRLACDYILGNQPVPADLLWTASPARAQQFTELGSRLGRVRGALNAIPRTTPQITNTLNQLNARINAQEQRLRELAMEADTMTDGDVRLPILRREIGRLHQETANQFQNLGYQLPAIIRDVPTDIVGNTLGTQRVAEMGELLRRFRRTLERTPVMGIEMTNRLAGFEQRLRALEQRRIMPDGQDADLVNLYREIGRFHLTIAGRFEEWRIPLPAELQALPRRDI